MMMDVFGSFIWKTYSNPPPPRRGATRLRSISSILYLGPSVVMRTYYSFDFCIFVHYFLCFFKTRSRSDFWRAQAPIYYQKFGLIFNGFWTPARPQHGPLEHHFLPKRLPGVRTGSYQERPGADLSLDLSTIWRRKRSKDTVLLIWGRFSMDFGRMFDQFTMVGL